MLALFLLPTVALADASVSVTPPYPGTTVNAGTRVSFSVVPSGFDGPVTYRIVDSFGGGANTGNIDSGGSFFYNTNQSVIGTHTITITATDALGTTSSATQTITVQSGPTASLQASSSSATIGTQLSFTITAQGLFNPTYGMADSFVGSSLRTDSVTADGIAVWTPLWQDIGTHTITATVKDNLGFTATSSQTITIVSGLPQTPTSTPVVTTPTPTATTTATTSAPQTTTPPKTASGYTFTKFLAVGSTGADVTALQHILITGGYLSGSATGYFGQLTKRAVAAYQSAHGLPPLGYVGPGTRAALTKGNY